MEPWRLHLTPELFGAFLFIVLQVRSSFTLNESVFERIKIKNVTKCDNLWEAKMALKSLTPLILVAMWTLISTSSGQFYPYPPPYPLLTHLLIHSHILPRTSSISSSILRTICWRPIDPSSSLPNNSHWSRLPSAKKSYGSWWPRWLLPTKSPL